MIDHDPVIRIEIVAAAMGRSYESLNREIRLGRMPGKVQEGRVKGWRLSTLAAWHPRLARNIEGLLNTPYLPAA